VRMEFAISLALGLYQKPGMNFVMFKLLFSLGSIVTILEILETVRKI